MVPVANDDNLIAALLEVLCMLAHPLHERACCIYRFKSRYCGCILLLLFLFRVCGTRRYPL